MKSFCRIGLGLALVLLLAWPAEGQDPSQYPKELNLVLEYIKRSDYPEVFDQRYQVRVRGLAIIDIDGDGKTEVFLQTFPHYRQSPTVTIYQVDRRDTVARLPEGLAPGKLVPLDSLDDYLDSHVLGRGIDLQLGSADITKMRIFALASIKQKMSVVIYKSFIHTDQREGKPVYLDLSHLEGMKKTCEDFQFQRPASIVAGVIPGKKEKCFLALTGGEIYCYAIKGITAEGLVDKTIYVAKVPTDFEDFTVEQGVIKYKSHDNSIKPLPF